MTSAPDSATVAVMDADLATARPIEAAALTTAVNLRHGFFTREGGVSAGIYGTLNTGLGSHDERAAVAENRARAAAALGARACDLATPHQLHSVRAVTVDTPWPPGGGPKADALVTDRPGVVIGVGTADCAPILLADPEAGVVAAAHAGWKGALTGIVEATVEAMAALGARAERSVAVVGPTISGQAYEVGPEFVARFSTADPANARFFLPSERPGHARFDLPAYIVARLSEAGIGHAEDTGHCTYADAGRFFSYRRATHRGEPDYGRLLSAIMITTE